MRVSRRWPIFLGLSLGMVALIGGDKPAASAGTYDGLWSVSIITESGTCDRAYRYPVRISDGNVFYNPDPGGPSIDISGRVEPSGQVKVIVRRGDQYANGSGRLSPKGGVGTWLGKASTRECSGRWEAERR